MDYNEISLPPVHEYRYHLRATLHYMQAYLMASKILLFPYEEIEKIITIEEAKTLEEKIKAGEETLPLDISEADVLTIYAANDIANKILITRYGEELGEEVLKEVSADSKLKKFADYRAFQLKYNTHMITDIEIKMPNLDGLAELRIRLCNLIIE